MRPTSGTTIIDIADPRAPRVIAKIDVPRRLAFAQGARRQRHHDRQSGEVRKVQPQTTLAAASTSTTCPSPTRPKLISRMADRRRRRAPLRFRRPLRLYLADGRRLYRQYRDDPRSRRSGEAGRGRPLVDSRASGRPAARNIPGQIGCRRAAIIRCATATVSMSATGITVLSFSTSPTCRSRSWCRSTTPARLFRIRPIPAW